MTRAFLHAGVVVFASFACGSAFADANSANACAAGLSPSAKAIYDAAAPEFASSADPRAMVRSKTMGLVKAGTVKQSEARADAMTAGDCLKKLR